MMIVFVLFDLCANAVFFAFTLFHARLLLHRSLSLSHLSDVYVILDQDFGCNKRCCYHQFCFFRWGREMKAHSFAVEIG